MNNEEATLTKDLSKFKQLPVRIHKGPNPVRGAIICVHTTQVPVEGPIREASKLCHTSFVKKNSTVRFDLQYSRELEDEAPQEKVKQECGFPCQKSLRYHNDKVEKEQTNSWLTNEKEPMTPWLLRGNQGRSLGFLVLARLD